MAAQKTAKKTSKKNTSTGKAKAGKKGNGSAKSNVRRPGNNTVALILAAAAVVLLIYFIMVIPGTGDTGSGLVLQFLANVFSTLFGLVRYCFPVYLLILAWAFHKRGDNSFKFGQFVVFGTLLFLSVCACFCLGQGIVGFKEFMGIAAEGNGGGVIGGFIAYYLLLMFNPAVSAIILVLVGLICVNALCNYVLWHKLVDLCSRGLVSLKDKQGEARERRREEKAIEEQASALEDDYDEDGLPWDEKEDTTAGESQTPGKKQGSLLAGLFGKSNKNNQNQNEGKKRRKTVEYHSEDKITVDGVTFTRDYSDSEYDIDPVSFRQHLTGKSEMDEFAPVYDETETEPDMNIVAGLQGGYGDENITTQVFKPADFRDDGEEEPSPIMAEEENAHGAEGRKYAFEDEFELPCDPEPEAEPETGDKAAAGDGGSDDFEPEKAPAKPAVPVYKLPKVAILTKGSKANQRQMSREIKENVATLERTLDSFGVQAQVTEVSCGPSLIRYEVQPGPGVKVSKIVSLTDDIALALAAASIRMEAPVPGKSVIGIEVPRKEAAPVMFRDILEQSRFFELPSKLTCAYGLDIAGNPVVGDLAGMPHLLIAGTTGSGKSVCMNTMICSILFKATPDEVKFIMIDPKQVEFVIYEGLPHLLTPVVTDPRKAAGALKWALREMENRYTLFNQNRVRNIQGYNALVENEEDKLPQIVIFIDELADLMMVAAKDVEASICRLAQKARAAGIHLVIATQRPSVDVITGLIKANIPSRIALSVSSQIDSRTILDLAGAEKLLGHGDMLYMPVGYSKPLRVQGAWLSDEDARSILDFYRKQGEPEYIEGVAKAPEEIAEEKGPDVGDELFFEAAKAAITAGQASTSMMQRRFRIGYNRAARIMEELEEKGIIGAAEGAKPRSVLMSLEVFKEKFREPEEQNLFE